MSDLKILLLTVILPFGLSGGMEFENADSNASFIAYAWHKDLGISDLQAGELYKTNPNDPQIVGWKNGIQKTAEDFKSVCGPESFLDITAQDIIDLCVGSGRELNGDCVTHPGQAIACLDPMIQEWAAKGNSTGAP